MDKNKTYLACGYFDSVHIGHRKVIDELVKKCKQDNAYCVVVILVDKNLQSGAMVYTYEERTYVLKKLGVDKVDYFEYESFKVDNLVNNFFLKKHHVSRYFTGSFDDDMIINACQDAGLAIERIPLHYDNNVLVSTDLVVQAIKNDDFDLMQKLMGHEYIVIGEIVHGKGEGHKFGMPTANLSYADYKILPPYGVYATTCIVKDEKYKGCTNIGLRPSADNMTHISIETYLLDFDCDIYGERVVIEVVHYVRPVIKFDGGLSEVKKQIEKDILVVRDVLC